MSMRFLTGWRIVLVFLATTSSIVNAMGTPSGARIGSSAWLQCNVCGDGIPSNTVVIMVDNKVIVTVAESRGAPTGVTAGQAVAVTTFSVTNNGNTVQDYALSVANVARDAALFGASNLFDALACVVRVKRGTSATYDAAVDTATYIDELAPDSSRTVYVVCSVPTGRAVNDQSIIRLLATTLSGGTPGAQSAVLAQTAGPNQRNAVEVVFADAAGSDDVTRDGAHSARSAYRLDATASLLKSITNIQDPLGCNAASGCKVVPGSVLTYRIDFHVPAASEVVGLLLSDPIPPNMTYLAGSIIVDGVARTDAADGDKADFGITAPNTVTLTLGTVRAPLTTWFSFRATIN